MKDNSFFNQFGNYNQSQNVPLPSQLQQIKPQTQYQNKQQQQGQQGYYHKQNNQMGGKKQFTKQQLQQFQQFQKELEYEQQQQKNQQQQQQQQQQFQQQQKSNQLYFPNIQGVNLYNPLAMHQFPPLYNIYEQPHIFQQFTIPMQPQPQMMPDVMLHYPPITTMTPMQHEVDWFYGKEGWKMFDSRRCNLVENMMHHNTQSEFELVYRDAKSIIDFRAMTFYDSVEDCLYKLRRETPICSKIIRIGQGTWSFYNGLTWIQYDRMVILQLEERLRHGEIHFTIYVDGKEYTFDLDQNVQVCDPLPLGKGDRKIITRQWMTMQQLQDIGRMKKHQEQVYIEERKKLEDRVKQHIIQKKAIQTSMKQQQRQYWNQMKKSSQQSQQQSNNSHPNLLNDNFNLKELDLGISKNPIQEPNKIEDNSMMQNFILQDLSLDSMQSNNYNPFKTLQELDLKVLDTSSNQDQQVGDDNNVNE